MRPKKPKIIVVHKNMRLKKPKIIGVHKNMRPEKPKIIGVHKNMSPKKPKIIGSITFCMGTGKCGITHSIRYRVNFFPP
jgi:hypothetical protein